MSNTNDALLKLYNLKSLDEATRECGECGGKGEHTYGHPDPERVRCDACHGTGKGNWPWWRRQSSEFDHQQLNYLKRQTAVCDCGHHKRSHDYETDDCIECSCTFYNPLPPGPVPYLPNLSTDTEACVLVAGKLHLTINFQEDGCVSEFDWKEDGRRKVVPFDTFNAAVEAALVEAGK